MAEQETETETQTQTRKVCFAIEPENDLNKDEDKNGTNGQIPQYQSRRHSNCLYVENKKWDLLVHLPAELLLKQIEHARLSRKHVERITCRVGYRK